MATMTRAERARLTALVLYPEDENELLKIGQVARMTHRSVRVVRHFIRKGVLPAQKQPNGSYRIEARHVAVVLFQPAWGSTRTGRTRTTNLPEIPTPTLAA